MSYPISLSDVAQAANVSISTVSLVVNGKADRRRIAPATQERVRAAARQLGYQPNQIARDIVLGKGRPQPLGGISAAKSQTPELKPDRQQMGLILSAASSTETLGVIPGLAPLLDSADYRLIIVTVPPDPVAARARVIRFLADGLAGILCCPTVYPAVLATVAETFPDPNRKVPVLVLWQGAGQAMLKAVGKSVSSEQSAVGSKPVPVVPVAPLPHPIPVPTPVVTPKSVNVTPPPPVAAETPVVAPEPAIVVPPAAGPTPEPVIVPEPVTTPEPAVVEAIPAPEPIPAPPPEPIPVPTPVDVETPVVAQPTPVLPPEPVIVVPPTLEPTPEPAIAPEPVATPEPVVVEAPSAPVIEPILPPPPEPIPVPTPVDVETPVVAPEPVIVVPPTPEPIPEPVIAPEPAVTPEPVVVEAPPAPEPAPIPAPETEEEATRNSQDKAPG